MESIIRRITRPMIVNGVCCVDVNDAISDIQDGNTVSVYMKAVKVDTPDVKNTSASVVLSPNDMRVNRTYIIKVRQYMTKPASIDFDFQRRWNNDVPMPFRIMKGRVLKETRGMVMMDCWAVPLKTDVCMRCGRPLTHPVSRLYGIGPECGSHAHVNPFDTEEELRSALDDVTKQLESVKWRGWIIKSAIEECQESK